MSELIIKDLHVSVGEEEILKGVNLKVNSNEVHALMGPNGAGKSTLGYAIMGHPKYRITKGEINFLQMEDYFESRYLNEGFSGGEKKRCEILQLAILQPHLAILDETDSGLDIDSLKIVADGINELSSQNIGILLITHYQRIL